MACERRRKSLSRVAAGESPDTGLQGHLEVCAPCRLDLEAAREALAALDAELGDLAGVTPGKGFSRRVLRAAERPTVGSTVWLPWAAAAAVALAALGLLARALLEPGEPSATARAVAEVREEGPGGVSASASPAGAVAGVAAAGDARPEASPPASPAPAGAASRPVPPRAASPSPADVRVPAGQLKALVVYARLRRGDERALAGGAGTPLAALATDPIRVKPLSVEPLSFDAEGASR